MSTNAVRSVTAMDGGNTGNVGAFSGNPVEGLITKHLDLWTAAIKRKSTAGRGSSSKIELYGIKKLRELILELAVRGLLVPQDPSDEPASELLKRIAAEKTRLIKDKKIKNSRVLAAISDDEEFMPLPKGWAFARLNDLGDWGAGATPSRNSPELYGGNIPWFKSGELIADYISKSDETVTELALQKSSLRYNRAGDVLIAMYGATIGKTAILSVPATTNQAVCACTPFGGFENTYLLALLKAYKPRFIGMGAGGAQPNISREKIIETVVALPPTVEQHRIVAKVDELMALCDRLEQHTDASLSAHQTLVQTLLNALTSAADHQQFINSWQRIAEHFDTLFTTIDAIDQLKQTILQLAVMGKLVPQDPNDEPASELLKKIAAEKAKLVKEGKIRKEKPQPPVGRDESPFELPSQWRWARLQEVATKITDGDHKTPPRTDTGMRMLSAKNVRDGFLDFDNCDFISKDDYLKSRERCLPETGDLLVVSVGGTIGRSSLVPKDSQFSLVRSVALIKPILLSSGFLKYLADAPLLQDFIHRHKRGGAQPCLYLSEIAKFPIPFPPLSEQHRIVIKVDELMSLCDQLKTRLNDAQTTQLHLADAITQRALV